MKKNIESNLSNQKSTLNEYHRKRNIEAQREVEEMSKVPYTIEQMREQQKRLDNSIRNSMIAHIASYLTKHESIIETYSWELNISELIHLIQISKDDKTFFLDTNQSPFNKTIKLKELLTPILQDLYKKDRETFNKISLWLVKKWGGIFSGNDDELCRLIHESIDNFNNKNEINFKRISSKSKVLCFMFPESHIIYDSRVAYSLNWILLLESFGDQKYFPIPESRNSKLNAFDMKTLIRVKNIRIYLGNIGHINNISRRDKDYFIPDNLAYNEMNEILKDVNKLLWDKQPERKNEPFFAQMLLFTLADTIIFKEMKSKLKIALCD
jgi:hypothetical protein